MKATVKGRYEGDKAAAAATVAVSAAGDLRLKASATDAAFANGPSLKGLTLTLEKPGAFLLDLKPHNQDVRFQFMNSALVLNKRVSLTYTHSTTLAPVPAPAVPPSRTALDCTVTFDPANKVSVAHTLGSAGCRLKYTYAHGADLVTTMEPCFDTANNAWEFAVTRNFEGGDSLKGTYHASNKLLGLEWNRDSKTGGSFKVATTFDLSDQSKAPKLIAESRWNYEIRLLLRAVGSSCLKGTLVILLTVSLPWNYSFWMHHYSLTCLLLLFIFAGVVIGHAIIGNEHRVEYPCMHMI